MAQLARLPELVGFFSYSRDDDEAFKGSLSALRDAIQQELGAGLGRTKRNFRLWQDQEAIAPGKLWESQIPKAIEEAAFFIPIVTPRSVTSKYCKLEFEAFLTRERELGRTDLVFPILYISVPGLIDEAEWRDDPVLSVVAKRQYVDWRAFRRAPVDSPAFGQAIDRFCGKIIETLREPWLSPEERLQMEADAGKRAAETERIRVRAEAQKRATPEEELRKESQAAKPVESEAGEREEAERQQRQAKERSEERRKSDERTQAEVWAHRTAEIDFRRLSDLGGTETQERSSKPQRLSRRVWVIACMFIAVVAAGAAMWLNQYRLKEEVHPQTAITRPAPAPEKDENNTLTNASPLTAAQELALKPGDSFTECAKCPEMIVVPAGSFQMGYPDGQGQPYEHKAHTVTIAKPFAVAKFAVTFNQWDACAADHGCRKDVSDDAGRGQRPVINVTWSDTQAYIKWLSLITGQQYRLLSEAEYEYAARAGRETKYPWGPDIKLNGKTMANWNEPMPVGSFPPNSFGLYDMVGNVFEWTADCYHNGYAGAPADGAPWGPDHCQTYATRGGASAERRQDSLDDQLIDLGFRVARTLHLSP